jgi:hypothetical protein
MIDHLLFALIVGLLGFSLYVLVDELRKVYRHHASRVPLCERTGLAK